MAFQEEQLIQSTIISIVILIIFIFSFNTQSEANIENFENCISEESCLYELIRISNQTQLCDQDTNSSQCYLNFAITRSEPKLCYSTNKEFECIVSISVRSQENYCKLIRNESRFDECINNLIFYEVFSEDEFK